MIGAVSVNNTTWWYHHVMLWGETCINIVEHVFFLFLPFALILYDYNGADCSSCRLHSWWMVLLYTALWRLFLLHCVVSLCQTLHLSSAAHWLAVVASDGWSFDYSMLYYCVPCGSVQMHKSLVCTSTRLNGVTGQCEVRSFFLFIQVTEHPSLVFAFCWPVEMPFDSVNAGFNFSTKNVIFITPHNWEGQRIPKFIFMDM